MSHKQLQPRGVLRGSCASSSRLGIGQPLVALSASGDWTQFVTGGREGFAVVSLDEAQDTLVCAKYPNRISADITWNACPGFQHQLAYALDNGSIAIFDLNTSQVEVLQGHKLTVNSLRFHAQEPHTLFSGSGDHTVCMWDLRAEQKCVRTFKTHGNIRQIALSPHSRTHLATVTETGELQIWDTRGGERPEHMHPAHSGPAYSVCWHPETRFRLATGGRDRIIRIWDIGKDQTLRQDMAISTLSSVARVCWRPNRQYQLVSCALEHEFSINVWDVRRPFFPVLQFPGHTLTVTDIAWGPEDTMVSCSKDGHVIRHSLNAATRPGVEVEQRVAGVAWGPQDQLASIGRVAPAPLRTAQRGRRSLSPAPDEDALPSVPGRSEIAAREADSIPPSLGDMSRFVYFATNYEITGRPAPELCDANAAVADRVGAHQHAQTWRILKDLWITTNDATRSSAPAPAPALVASDDQEQKRRLQQPYLHLMGLGDSVHDTVMDSVDAYPHDSTLLAETVIPHEPLGNSDNESDQATHFLGDDEPGAETVDAAVAFGDVPAWDCAPLLESVLLQYAELNDIQMCVTIMLVYGAEACGRLPDSEAVAKAWFTAYCDLLDMHKLWTLRSLVCNLSHLADVQAETQKSTTINLSCNLCTRAIERQGWACHSESHRHFTNSCSVCHTVVKGMYAWCQGCGHGGHLDHMRQWLALERVCPTGCGHQCQL